MDTSVAIAAVLAAAMIYMFPYAVAWSRGHRNAAAISVLNLLLGWTLIGWIIALVWACTDQSTNQSIAAK